MCIGSLTAYAVFKVRTGFHPVYGFYNLPLMDRVVNPERTLTTDE